MLNQLLTALDEPGTLPAMQRLAAHLCTELPALFSFLFDPTIDATNWRAEQALRPAVVNRKVCGGNRSARGADTQHVLMSVLRTAQQRNLDAATVLVRAASCPTTHHLTGPRSPHERVTPVTSYPVRQWCGKFGPDYARQLKRRQGRLGDTWFLDEVFVTINGQRQYLWRAVDQDGDLIDILVQPRRYGRAARRFFRRLLKSQRQEPVRLVTDKLGSYRVAHRDLMPLVTHDTRRYANNRAEVSHQPTRQRERQMRGFTSSDHAQRFLHVHGVIQNLFRVGRHLLRAAHHRMLRARSFTVWAQVTAA